MSLIKKLNERIEERKDDQGKIKLSGLLTPILEVVKDGEVNSEDFPVLVDAVKEAIAVGIPLIDFPYVPNSLEPAAIDSWLIPLAQSFADELVKSAFQLFHIPIPE